MTVRNRCLLSDNEERMRKLISILTEYVFNDNWFEYNIPWLVWCWILYTLCYLNVCVCFCIAQSKCKAAHMPSLLSAVRHAWWRVCVIWSLYVYVNDANRWTVYFFELQLTWRKHQKNHIKWSNKRRKCEFKKLNNFSTVEYWILKKKIEYCFICIWTIMFGQVFISNVFEKKQC